MTRTAHPCRHCSFDIPADAPVCPGCGRPAIDDWRKQARALKRQRRVTVPAEDPLREEGYRSLVARARVGRLFLALQFLLLLAYAATVSAWWWLEDNEPIALGDRTVGRDALATGVGAALVAASLGSGVAFVAWLLRANRNLAALRIEGQRFGAVWVVLAWFIPGANLFLPKMVVDDVWRASSPNASYRGGTGWRNRPLGPAVQRWWFSWLTAPAIAVVGITVALGRLDEAERNFGVAAANAVAVAALIVSAMAARDIMAIVTVAQAQRADVVVDIRDGERLAETTRAARTAPRRPAAAAPTPTPTDE